MGKTEKKSRSIWNAKKKTSDLLPTLLPNLLTYRLQMFYKLFGEYPKRTSIWGLQISEKKRESSGFEPLLETVEGWGISGLIWAAPPLYLCKTYHKPTSKACLKSQKIQRNYQKKLVQKTLI